MKRSEYLFFGMVVLLLTAAGCASIITNSRAVSVQDVIYLTRHQLGPDVIIKHIEATGSRFDLSTEDIVTLKDAGVDERVIETMVELSAPMPPFDWESPWPPYASYMPLNNLPPVRLYDYYYFPLYESYSGYYDYPYSIYDPMLQRRAGLIGRFYEYVPPSSLYRNQNLPYGARRNDSQRPAKQNNDNPGTEQ